jgi:D-amino peptidase
MHMKIFIFADLEGCSGICKFTQTSDKPDSKHLPPQEAMVDYAAYDEARHLLMGDLNACIDGLRDAGVDEIVARDGHGIPYNFVPGEMRSGVRYCVGEWGDPPLGGLEPDCDAIILLGHHAMAGTPDGILCHTQSPARDDHYFYNERETGEIGQEALIAGHFGIPLIMVTGDDAACRETRDFFGDAPVAVSVKTGLSREGALFLPPETARQLIREGAKEAVARLPQCKPYTIDLPIHARLRVKDKAAGDRVRPKAGTRVDDVTFEATLDRACDIFHLC